MKSKTARLAVGAALAAASLYVVASWDGFADSVHFYEGYGYAYSYEPNSAARHFVDFGRAPQRVMIDGWNNEMVRAGSWMQSDHWYRDDLRKANLARRWSWARNLELAGRYAEALKAYAIDDDVPGRKSFIRDRREVYASIDGKPSGATATYLRGRYMLESEYPAIRTKGATLLKGIRSAGRLVPNIAYALAGEMTTPEARADAYRHVAESYPTSPRAAAALIMEARVLLDERRKTTQTETSRAKDALTKLSKRFPSSPYRWSALGWEGRVAYLSGDYPLAMKFYRKQVELASNNEERFNANASMSDVLFTKGARARSVVPALRNWRLDVDHDRRIRAAHELENLFARLNAQEAAELQKLIRNDADLLEAYIGYRIEDTGLLQAQERNLLRFASSSVNGLEHVSADLLQRIAQIAYNSGHYKTALAQASRALKSSGTVHAKHRAEYVRAASLNRLGLPKNAIAAYESLIAKSPAQYLRQSAREALAILHERHGDPVEAMRQYVTMRKADLDGVRYEYGNGDDYETDVAYMADAKLTPAQLRAYLNRYPNGPKQDVLVYTLGMRYLRTGEYDEAEAAFKRLTKPERLRYGLSRQDYIETRDNWGGHESFPNQTDPLQTVRDLRRLESRAKSARSSNARAQAIYDHAAYVYNHRNLLFYSLGLWKGSKSYMVDIHWSTLTNDKTDEQALKNHFYEHECVAHVARLCKSIVDKYPKAPIRPKAMYTYAIATERMSNLNSWWRSEQKNGTPTAIKMLKRLVKEYPKHPLAKPASKYADTFAKEHAINYELRN